MQYFKQKKLLLSFLLFLVTLISCNQVSTSELKNYFPVIGVVAEEDASPAINSTLVLVKNENGKPIEDYKMVMSNNKGEFIFKDVAKGYYNLVFSSQSEEARKAKIPVLYNTEDKTSYHFAAISTNEFEYDSNKSKTIQIPAFNVGWKANLEPYQKVFNFGEKVKFSWSKVKDGNVTSYRIIIIEDTTDTIIFKSPETSDNFYTLDSNSLKKETHYKYFVEVKYTKPIYSEIYITQAVSARSSFKIN